MKKSASHKKREKRNACPRCKGEGHVVEMCNDCQGHGCLECEGQGYIAWECDQCGETAREQKAAQGGVE